METVIVLSVVGILFVGCWYLGNVDVCERRLSGYGDGIGTTPDSHDGVDFGVDFGGGDGLIF